MGTKDTSKGMPNVRKGTYYGNLQCSFKLCQGLFSTLLRFVGLFGDFLTLD